MAERVTQKRARNNKLQGEQLSQKRACRAAEHKQRQALKELAPSDVVAAEALAASEHEEAAARGEYGPAVMPSVAAASGGASPAREAVLKQNQLLVARCEEVRALEEKVAALREELRTVVRA